MKPEYKCLECVQIMAEAKKMLGKARNKNGLYDDIKVVQKACDMVYKSVLMALKTARTSIFNFTLFLTNPK
jgi:hypothetical protein